MQILFSPAKKMRRDADTLPPAGLPRYLEQADRLRAYLKELPYEELKRLLACNDAIAQLNYRRYQTMDLRRDLTPAILAYDGIAYQYMAPQVFERAWFDYIHARVFVLSGLYGILRPLDGVVPYRLEMQTKLRTEFCRDLYDYWGDRLARTVCEQDDVVVDLASGEYGRAVRRCLPKGVRLVECIFGELAGEKVMEKGVYVKMARGEMVRWLAEHNAQAPEEMTAFRRLDFVYCPERSTPDRLVFLREGGRPKPRGR